MTTDKIEISDCVTLMLQAIDALDWNGVRVCFADRVLVDYTSLFGGQPADMLTDDLLKSWRGLLPGFEATQHMTGPVVASVSGSNATAETHVRGYHHIKGNPGGEMWMVAGHYTLGMKKQDGVWCIRSLKLTASYQEGNLQLPAAATARVGKGLIRSEKGG